MTTRLQISASSEKSCDFTSLSSAVSTQLSTGGGRGRALEVGDNGDGADFCLTRSLNVLKVSGCEHPADSPGCSVERAQL